MFAFTLTILFLISWNPDSLRSDMVETQIQARGIEDTRVLRAMRTVERHRFVPEPFRALSYRDGPLPIGEDQTISQPFIVALMTELLDLEKGDKVLEVGTGSGYQAAVLAELTDEVYSIEIVDVLAMRAESTLLSLGYETVRVRIGDGYQGWPEHAPFDGIIVTCAPPYIPQPLIDQLAEGGRMVIPVGVHIQELELIERVEGEILERSVIPVRFVPMTGPGVENGSRPDEDE
jgi:protein-L-isoaspartate(D-aspartate) O-methyltransferase